MPKKTRIHLLTTLVAFAATALLIPAMAAAQEENGWSLRLYLASLDFDLETQTGSELGYDSSVGGGIGFNAEYRFSRRLGVDLGLLGAGGVDVSTSAVSPTGVETDTLGFTPLTVGLAVHLTPDQRFDLTLTPLLAWIRYGGVSVRTTPGSVITQVSADDDLAPGAALGVAVPFGRERNWSVVAGLTYFDSRLEGPELLQADYDTTVLGLGIGYRL